VRREAVGVGGGEEIHFLLGLGLCAEAWQSAFHEHLQRLLVLSPIHPKRAEYLEAINYLAPQIGKGVGDRTDPGVR